MMILPVLILGMKDLLPLIFFAKDKGISIDNLVLINIHYGGYYQLL